MATCRDAGFSPGIRHLANSIFTQLAMAASGLGVTLVPNGPYARSSRPPRTAPSLTARTSLNSPSYPGQEHTNR